jgi:hypothetical protein
MHNVNEDYLSLDWGVATPEAYNRETNTAMYVFNCALNDSVKLEKCLKFVAARILWYIRNLPPNTNHLITFDTRGGKV